MQKKLINIFFNKFININFLLINFIKWHTIKLFQVLILLKRNRPIMSFQDNKETLWVRPITKGTTGLFSIPLTLSTVLIIIRLCKIFTCILRSRLITILIKVFILKCRNAFRLLLWQRYNKIKKAALKMNHKMKKNRCWKWNTTKKF